MPILPSGRRVEFSLDRFHAMLDQMQPQQAAALAEALDCPDDLLFVMDAVHFRLDDGTPYFASYVAASWQQYAADWSEADRTALAAWFRSQAATEARADAINDIHAVLRGKHITTAEYPCIFSAESAVSRAPVLTALH